MMLSLFAPALLASTHSTTAAQFLSIVTSRHETINNNNKKMRSQFFSFWRCARASVHTTIQYRYSTYNMYK